MISEGCSCSSPPAWGFSFVTVSTLTTKLACVALSSSATLSMHICPFNASSFACLALLWRSGFAFFLLPVRPHKSGTRACLSLTKKNSFVRLSWKDRHSASTFLFLVANASLLLLLTPVNHWGYDTMTRVDSYADVVFGDLDLGPQDSHPPRGHLIANWKSFFLNEFFVGALMDCLVGHVRSGGPRFPTRAFLDHFCVLWRHFAVGALLLPVMRKLQLPSYWDFKIWECDGEITQN